MLNAAISGASTVCAYAIVVLGTLALIGLILYAALEISAYALQQTRGLGKMLSYVRNRDTFERWMREQGVTPVECEHKWWPPRIFRRRKRFPRRRGEP